MSLLLTDSQHDEIMRGYQDLRLDARFNADNNRRIAYEAIPELKDLDHRIAEISIDSLRSSDPGDIANLKASIDSIGRQKRDLLLANGFPEDYLEIHYRCTECKDSGYIGDKRCDCFKRRIIKLIYSEKYWRNLFEAENFDTFDLSLYGNEITDEETGITPRSAAINAISKAHIFVDECLLNDGSGFSNLIISGNTGIGKTFLCNCIARDLIEAGLYVVYLTAPSLFEIFEKASFGRRGDGREYSTDSFGFTYSSVFECDLLIIDDLGTEFSNGFTNAKIFDLLNRRLLNKLPTLISTNLNLQGLKDIYSERFVSRIIGNYGWISLMGEDIRQKRRFISNKPA